MTSPEPARRMPPTALATCVLPWDDRLRFDEAAFREHVRLVAAHMTRHLYVFGTAGEGYAVTETQFRGHRPRLLGRGSAERGDPDARRHQQLGGDRRGQLPRRMRVGAPGRGG